MSTAATFESEQSSPGEVQTVAALYVDPKGVYANLPGVEVWDEARDARTYAGPWPVVAHPPCNRWAKLGRRELRGEDGGCFSAALVAVRTFGGVLEHPAETYAWATFGLARPVRHGWTSRTDDPGWTIELDQHAYGFPTRKPTWLYACAGDPVTMPYLVAPRALRGCDSLWSTERAHTPPAFRDVLLAMARSAAVPLPPLAASEKGSPGHVTSSQ